MNLNKVTLIGRVGKNPEIRTFPNGGKMASVSLATTEKWRDRQTGETKSHTEWHELVFNGGVADIVEKYVQKGMVIYVEGALRTRKWQDKASGQDRFKTEISVQSVQLGPAPNASAAPSQRDGGHGTWDPNMDHDAPF